MDRLNKLPFDDPLPRLYDDDARHEIVECVRRKNLSLESPEQLFDELERVGWKLKGDLWIVDSANKKNAANSQHFDKIMNYSKKILAELKHVKANSDHIVCGEDLSVLFNINELEDKVLKPLTNIYDGETRLDYKALRLWLKSVQEIWIKNARPKKESKKLLDGTKDADPTHFGNFVEACIRPLEIELFQKRDLNLARLEYHYANLTGEDI